MKPLISLIICICLIMYIIFFWIFLFTAHFWQAFLFLCMLIKMGNNYLNKCKIHENILRGLLSYMLHAFQYNQICFLSSNITWSQLAVSCHSKGADVQLITPSASRPLSVLTHHHGRLVTWIRRRTSPTATSVEHSNYIVSANSTPKC